MKQVSIYKNGNLTNQAKFETIELANQWLEREVNNGSFGKPEHQVLVSPEQTIQIEAIFDEQGNELEPARTEIIEAVYETIPSEFTVEIVDITSEVEAEANKNAKLEAGRKAREVCIRCLDIIAGHNLEQALTAEQITEMQSTFAPIQSALMTSRPTTAKALITALQPDGILVSQELKDLVLAELQEY